MTAPAEGAAPLGARVPQRLAAPILGLYPALGVPGFRLLWLGQLPATLAFQMGIVARPYVAFALTGSASMLGLVSLASGLPMLLLSLVGGVVADRLSRRTVLVWTHALFMLSAVTVAVLALTNNLQFWHLLVMGLAHGTVMSRQVWGLGGGS